VLHSGNRREIARTDEAAAASMTQAVTVGAVAVAALNAASGALGAWLWYWGEPSEAAARAFWALLRLGQGAALTLAIAVGSLAAAGKHPREGLFYLYALLPLAVGVVGEQLRATSAQVVLDQRDLDDARAVGKLPRREQLGVVAQIVRREIGVMALASLVVVFLALRAASTAHGF
jgi:hypothetical protein